MARMRATDVSRNFSEVLNRVASGEEIEVVRNGAPVARLSRSGARFVSAERFRELITDAPRTDDRFEADLREVRSGTKPPPTPSKSSPETTPRSGPTSRPRAR
jgi:prevent-host-death family protein